MGSRVINLLRQEEQKARLRFWRMLMVVGASGNVSCPFCAKEPPSNAILIGVMPQYLRAAFVKAYNLRSEDRKSEAEIFEEAISDLLQEHFKKIISERKSRGEPPIVHFLLAKNWNVYAMPGANQ
jgi:hypothetical protein